MNLVFDEEGAAIPEGWTTKDVKDSQERTVKDALRRSEQPLTVEQVVQKSGGIAETYIRETLARLQAKFEVFILGEHCYLFDKDTV